MVDLVGFFWGTDDQKCYLRVLLRFVVWVRKVIFGAFVKKLIFFLQFTHNGEYIKNSKKKILKILFFDGAE